MTSVNAGCMHMSTAACTPAPMSWAQKSTLPVFHVSGSVCFSTGGLMLVFASLIDVGFGSSFPVLALQLHLRSGRKVEQQYYRQACFHAGQNMKCTLADAALADTSQLTIESSPAVEPAPAHQSAVHAGSMCRSPPHLQHFCFCGAASLLAGAACAAPSLAGF